jgi:pantoate--beta-alanine ligase
MAEQRTARQVEVVRGAAAMRRRAASWRRSGHGIGVVPTMGALHEGHLSLVRQARADNERVVVTIFVNPLQFGPGEDFGRYPRHPERDIKLLGAEGVDAVYMPGVEEMYPPGATTRIRVHELDEVLEGERRPGHFEGVATVVTKLFNATAADRAYFGQKDAQQAAVITRMAGDLDTGVEVVVMPTVREPDGLALSSRNVYLTPDQRRAAPCLSRSLDAANRLYLGGQREATPLRAAMSALLQAEPLAAVDYAEVVEPLTFTEPGTLAVLAVRFGETRLIDNHPLGAPLGPFADPGSGPGSG